MNLDKTLASALMVAALSLAPMAVDAQGGGNGGRQRGGGRSSAGAPAQRNEGGRQAAVRQAPRQQAPQGGEVRSRSSESRPSSASAAPPPQARSDNGRTAVPRSQANRQNGAAQPAPRSYEQAAPRQGSVQSAPRRAVPRQSYQYGPQANRPSDRYYSSGDRYLSSGRRYVQPPRYYYARPYYGRVCARPYSGAAYSPYYFGLPYYTFRPWFSIGFGLSIGYPVPYPYAYLGSYTPRVYGDYPPSYSVTPGVSIYGGVSFDIQPADADIWVDDAYVGTVGTFTPHGEPLTLTPGQHRVVVQRQGYRTMEWDVMIEPGQVIPYRGVMQPI